ncbi:glycogen synthase [Flavobacterium agrisoli]|uniref:Glycogen synthase n=1 Tax=Flavobacterium agrisoli TaxID=2793066 RepID=A0A934PI59_9FLAO|nr:glycogen synthase [Flavobacterium agrisoli]MBK0368546.1 glycogen synthase [Flavobacterium agrisoli]
MKIVHISAECYPMAKVGGLADVVGALPKYQEKAGHESAVIMPAYQTKFRNENHFEIVFENEVILGKETYPFQVLKERSGKLGFSLYLISIKEFFDRSGIYGFEDDIERFISFQLATLDWLTSINEIPDVINCHDHHTGLIPFLMQLAYKYKKLQNVKSVLTIHNGLYQGQFGFDKIDYLPEFDKTHIRLLEWDNCVNSLAVGVKCAHAVTTVSPSYLQEICHFANGLESLFTAVSYKSKGILNGIDTEFWNPKTDTMIAANYDLNLVNEGKNLNKLFLCEKFNLNPDLPLFGFIGRLFEEKGGDLLPETVATILKKEKNANFLVLGSGKSEIEQQLKDLVTVFPGNYNTFIGYDETMAHQVYAGADFLLMPSRVEPCGLNQMYALRYGTVPIVRRTGGLQDTITDFGDNGNGICHQQASVEDICYSVNRAIGLYEDKNLLDKIISKGMQTDHSWESVCQDYITTYQLINII